jgi:hypothetical protein
MARLIEITDPNALPAQVSVALGDVLWFAASGGRILPGEAGVVELVGIYQHAMMAPAGEIVAPAGPPTAVLVRAVRGGAATIEVMTGDPFRQARPKRLRVIVLG